MKKIFKVFVLVFFIVLMLIGCKKKENEIEKPDVEKNLAQEYKEKIIANPIGIVEEEFGIKEVLIQYTNNNDVAIYVHTTVDFYKDSQVVSTSDLFSRIGSNKSVYAVIKYREEFLDFDNYKFDYTVDIEKLEDYETIYNGINVTHNDTGNNISISVTNNGIRTTNPSIVLIFYNNGKIVSVKQTKEYNLIPSNTKTIVVDYPRIDLNNKMQFNKVEVLLNEVSTEL